jgi:hypothetical protein
MWANFRHVVARANQGLYSRKQAELLKQAMMILAAIRIKRL